MSASNRRRMTIGAAAATALLTLTACGQIYPSKTPAQGPANGIQTDVHKVIVGFAQQQLQAPYFAAMQVRAQQIAKEKGFKLLFQAANKDPVVQMNQMQAMMAQGANVLVVNATSVKGQKEMMTQIASKIPVIYIDTSVPGTGTTSVQSDNLTIGRESGKITAKRFLSMGKSTIKLVILTGPATDEFVGPARRQGFLDGLKEGGVGERAPLLQRQSIGVPKPANHRANTYARQLGWPLGTSDSLQLRCMSNTVLAGLRMKVCVVGALPTFSAKKSSK